MKFNKKNARFILFLSFLGLLGPAVLATLDWYKKYIPIIHPTAILKLKNSYNFARNFFGDPSFPIHKISLRLSTPLREEDKDSLKSGFRLTEISDQEQGILTIYLSVPHDHPSFDGQLTHEVCHLIEPKLFDVYAEGTCTLFAKMNLQKTENSWEIWENYFKEGNDPFYASTFFMMEEIYNVVGSDHLKRIFQFARYVPDDISRKEIKFNDWMATLPRQMQRAVGDVVFKYKNRIVKNIYSPVVSFELPKYSPKEIR